jgi:hypothetical protein
LGKNVWDPFITIEISVACAKRRRAKTVVQEGDLFRDGSKFAKRPLFSEAAPNKEALPPETTQSWPVLVETTANQMAVYVLHPFRFLY